MSGIFDFLTNGTPASTTVSGGTTASLPPWYEQYQTGLLASGIATAQEPFQIYQGQRVADLNPSQTGYIGGAQNYAATLGPLAQVGANATARGTEDFDPAKLAQIMSPYTSQVADIIGDRGMQRWNEQILPGVMDTFTNAGQFGSKRNMDFVSNAARDLQREIADNQTTALNQGYATGLGGLEALRGLDIQSGAAATNQAKGALDTLQQAGALESASDQKSMDLAYQDFLEQRDYPKTQLSWLKGLAPGAPPSSTSSESTTTANEAGNSPLANIAGILSLLKGSGVY